MPLVRLASLKATASLDAAPYKKGAAEVDASNKKMTASQDGVKASMSQTQVRVGETAGRFNKYRETIDLAFRAQQRIAAGEGIYKRALDAGRISLADYNRNLDLLRAKYAAAAASQSHLQTTVQGLHGQFGRLSGAVALLTAGVAGFGAVSVARGVFDTALAFERIDKTLLAATGSSVAAAREFQFIRAEAQRLGLELTGTALEYAKLAAATRQTALEGQGARDIFIGVAEAATALSLKSEQTAGALTAIQQIISKGTVSAEELRGQLGERLVGAFNIAARSMGATTIELGKMLKAGELTADEFLPRFARELHNTFADVLPTATKGAQASLNRFQSAFKEMELALARGGFLDAVVTAMNDIRDVMTDPAFLAGIRSFGATIKDSFAFVVANSDLLLRIAGAYVGFRVGRVAGPVGGGVGALVGAFGSDAVGHLNQRSREAATATTLAASPEATFLSLRGVTAPSGPSPAGQHALNVAKAFAANDNAARNTVDKDRERAAKADADRQKALDKYLQGLDDELRLSKLSANEREVQVELLRALEIGQDKVTAATLAEVRARVEARQQVEAQRAAQEQLAEQQREALEDAKRRQQEFNDEVLGETASLIGNLWEGGKDGLDDTLTYWKQRLISWLSEMAAKLVLSPIIMPVLQSAGLGAGALGSATGGLGANFGASGVGGVSSLGASLGDLGKTIDQFGRDLGVQLGGAKGGIFAENTGLFGTNTFLSDVAGGALGGIGIGSTVGALTGGNSVGSAVGGLVGGALGSFLGPIGTFVGGAIGGFLGGLFGPKPSNQAAFLRFDEFGTATQVPYSKTTAETLSAVTNAAAQIKGGIEVLERSGATLTDRLTQIVLGSRDPSHIEFASGLRLRSATGDPNALALAAVQGLARSAEFDSASVATVAGRKFGSLEEFAQALDFAKNTYDAIAEARPGLTATEKAMKDLTAGLKAARREAEKYGLALDKLDAGATKLFDVDVAAQIRAIVDPVGAALDEFERGAQARLGVARDLGADLLQVERLNALEREQVLKQAGQASVASLKGLIDDIEFGGLALGVAPETQYFAALSSYNAARSGALASRTPEAIGEFETASRALLPIAQSFLGVSTRFGDVRAGVLETARTLGAPGLDASASAIVAATTQGTASIVEAVHRVVDEVAGQGDQLKRLNAFMQAMMSRLAA